ncbi:hypothetical protein DACRYDRAFT_25339 [Dacryopinax primogenitus]|uniref:HAD-superfamily phosphatase n=1 Tax=Dacryopinax primogenitus (strain DJM 731) TaxID=1858805 RepID=M5FN58_DACPD|nr:uncharacterized protein DACRYDRAFT_25339 [Dacryopinax primogenitus]EJT96870.1 hypothetical protein DACRYDRAFT_25339 [Dacryopinax primogenitus]
MPIIRHVFTALRIITKPSVLVPNLAVKSVANINFANLREAGYEGVVIDRDNCLTKPRQDVLVPSLKDAWSSCLESFPPSRVLIVSNSAGTSKDASFLQAEALTRNLGVPVMLHEAPKPWVKRPPTPSAEGVSTDTKPVQPRKVPTPRLVVIGDRLSTDIVLGARLPKSFSIWTTQVWEEESAGVRIVRLVEGSVLSAVKGWRGWRRKRRGLEPEGEPKEFVIDVPVAPQPEKKSMVEFCPISSSK